jgi:hypothetical protein
VVGSVTEVSAKTTSQTLSKPPAVQFIVALLAETAGTLIAVTSGHKGFNSHFTLSIFILLNSSELFLIPM